MFSIESKLSVVELCVLNEGLRLFLCHLVVYLLLIFLLLVSPLCLSLVLLRCELIEPFVHLALLFLCPRLSVLLQVTLLTQVEVSPKLLLTHISVSLLLHHVLEELLPLQLHLLELLCFLLIFVRHHLLYKNKS